MQFGLEPPCLSLLPVKGSEETRERRRKAILFVCELFIKRHPSRKMPPRQDSPPCAAGDVGYVYTALSALGLGAEADIFKRLLGSGRAVRRGSVVWVPLTSHYSASSSASASSPQEVVAALRVERRLAAGLDREALDGGLTHPLSSSSSSSLNKTSAREEEDEEDEDEDEERG